MERQHPGMDQARQLLLEGRLDDLERLRARSSPSQALHIAAALHLAQHQPEQALQCIRQSIQLESTFSQRNTLAVCLLHCGHKTEAALILQELVQEQPEQADLWFNLARACGPEARGLQAVRRALQVRPDWRQAQILEAQLVLGQGRPRQAVQLCLGLLQTDPNCQSARGLLIQSLLQSGQLPKDPRILEHLEASLGLPGAYQLVPAVVRLWPQDAERLLLRLLQEDLVSDLELERALTRWRRDFRYHPQPYPLAEALAAHNFSNEFCFVETPEELEGLSPDHPAYPLYRPLPEGYGGAPLVLQRHQEEPARERQWLQQFARVQRGEAVAQQYEENPYPRWRSLERQGPPQSLDRVLRGLFPQLPLAPLENPQILVAGCGTGRHALLCAQRFRNARVWAIDLSGPSLAYALRQAERFHIQNVHFLQADLLDLDQTNLPEAFDLIESIGVLHHLKDPAQGLACLRARLAPPGWMRLGFYSRRARQGLEPARQLARQLGHLHLRQLRARLIQQLAPQDLEFLSKIKDFYSLSGLRDLLLHERESEYTLPELSALLRQNGLQFVGFDSLPATITPRSGPTPGLDDLEGWDHFEQQHPRTFLGMYVFWCRPA